MFLAHFIDWLEEHARLKSIFVLIMVILPFNLLCFPWIGSQLEQISGYGLLDPLYWYSPTQVADHLKAYQSAGRTLYLICDWTLDLAYPVVYSLLFGMLLTMILLSAFPAGSPLQRMQLLPFAMAFFDYLENISISSLLILYPSQPEWLAVTASLFTSLKWCFALFSILALAFGLAGLVKASIPRKTT